ncbi:Transcription factor [Pleurostoma richardsiae]|uniref:Transcription factor n=1 Tax=Pleurostoma richardsiae TaxID=41990 RepID=A0AA38VF18_9PEZI|nr:Transcription factor [Pleurostoma richardsiae]
MANAIGPRERTFLEDETIYWKRRLVSVLPSQNQCDLLVSYFFENINWVYQVIHGPSFRAEYAALWAKDVADVDLIWLSLLFIIVCLSSMCMPGEMAEAVGFETADMEGLTRRWYLACRQALQAGGYDAKPTLTQIQVFLISQPYWYSTKSIETLNSHLGQAIRNAQALGLDKESPASITDCLEREMRHRVWWDLVTCDTFQSFCLSRPPLLQSHLSSVPFPSNCNDVDMTPTGINVRPLSEPTETSLHHFRARVFKVFNRLYINNCANLSSYSFVSAIDDEVTAITNEFPWYFDLPREGFVPPWERLPPNFSFLPWQYHLLHSCINIQRVRMYRPFLHPLPAGDSWARCVDAASSALAAYRAIRARDPRQLLRSHKTRSQAYQLVSSAVVIGTFLLVERPPDPALSRIRSDVEMIITDLRRLQGVAMVSDGLRVLHRILALYDARNSTKDSHVARERVAEAPTTLVPGIFSFFGGESSARKYLERCAIEYIMNDQSEGGYGSPGESGSAGPSEGFMWEALLDVSIWGESGDAFWAELDFSGEGGMGFDQRGG